MEHRWSPRRYLEGEVTMHYSPVGSFPAVLRDISLGGMFIETGDTALPSMRRSLSRSCSGTRTN